MCGPYIHWSSVGDDVLVEPELYNTHGDIKKHLIKPEMLAKHAKPEAIPRSDLGDGKYEVLNLATVLNGGIRIHDGEPTMKDKSKVPDELKTKLRAYFMASYPTPEALIPWIEKHYGQNGDEAEWRMAMPEWLSEEGQKRLLRDRKLWLKEKGEALHNTLGTWPQMMARSYAQLLRSNLYPNSQSYPQAQAMQSPQYTIQADPAIPPKKEVNDWTLKRFCTLFRKYPNAYWRGCKEKIDQAEVVPVEARLR